MIQVAMSKWPALPHWAFDAAWLGSDEHGDWLGLPAGTTMRRPGAEYVAPAPQVCLSPARELPTAERGWIATFHSPGQPLEVYVDITTPPVLADQRLTCVDLDLDVIRGASGRVWIDDEDEFADHRVSLAYPDDVIAAALSSCALVETLVTLRSAPFDGAHRRWLEAV